MKRPRRSKTNTKKSADDLIAALRAVQADAKRVGLNKLTKRDINAEIAASPQGTRTLGKLSAAPPARIVLPHRK